MNKNPLPRTLAELDARRSALAAAGGAKPAERTALWLRERALCVALLGMAPEGSSETTRYAATAGEMRGWVSERETALGRSLQEVSPDGFGVSAPAAGVSAAPLETLRGSGPAPSGFRTCFDGKCPARRNPCTGRLEKAGRHFHPLPAPSGAALEALWARERTELAAILARYGFKASDATVARLQAEGMGPTELTERARMRPATDVGGLTYTHGIALREGAS